MSLQIDDKKGDRVERRLAITYIVSATTTFGIGCLAIATAGGGLFVNAAPKPPAGTQIVIVDDYVVVHTPATPLVAESVDPAAADATVATATGPKSALTHTQVPAPAAPSGTVPAAAASPVDAPAADAPEGATPPAAAPASTQLPDQIAAPQTSPEVDEVQAPAPTPAIDPPATTSAPAARPPIPAGCHDPEFRNGAWHCDDD